jgi:hypothetical protein
MQAKLNLDILKAWVIYFLLKCAVVITAMYIGEHLGFLVASVEGPTLQEGVAMAWVALVVYYSAVAVIATLLFKWAVGRFVVSKLVQETPVQLSLLRYCSAWVVYATITSVLAYLITLVLEYTNLEVMLGGSVDASWTGWLRRFAGPIAVTLVSLLVFRWTVTKLLLADRSLPASPKA